MAYYNRTIPFLLIAVLFLSLNFFSNKLSILPIDRFLNNDFPSEQFVVTRLLHNHVNNLDDNGGFLFSRKQTYTAFMATDKTPFKDLDQLILDDTTKINYLSHIGFQDDLLTPVAETFYSVIDFIKHKTTHHQGIQHELNHYSSYYIIKSTQLFVTILNAIALSLILLWVKKEFSTFSAYCALALMLFTLPDLTFFGRAMWWMMFSWFIPFLTVLSAYVRNKGRPLTPLQLTLTSVLAGAFLTLKVSMGYEFTSTIMVSTLIPVTYFAISRQWRLRDWIIQCFIIGSFQLAGLGLVLYLHYEALNNAGYDAIDVIKNRLEKRAYGGEAAANIHGIVKKSTDISVINVYGRHLLWHQHVGRPEILVLIPGLLWLWNRRLDWNVFFTTDLKERALLASIILGGLGAASMFTLLKGHAYIHSFDVVAFSIPMNILICALYGQWIERRVKTL